MCPKWNEWIRLENVASSSTNTSTLQLHCLVILIIYQRHLLFAPFCHFWRRKHKTFLSNSLNSLCLCYFFPSAPFNLPENVPWIQISKQGQTKTLRKACRRCRWHTWFCFNWNWLFLPFSKNAENLFSCKEVWRSLSIESTKIDDRSDIGLMPWNHSKCLNEKLIFLVKLQRVCWAGWFFIMFSIVTFPSWLQGEMIECG